MSLRSFAIGASNSKWMSREATVEQEEHEYEGPPPGEAPADDQPGLSEEEAKAENEGEEDTSIETEVNIYG